MSSIVKNLLTLVLAAFAFVACQHDDRRFYNYPDAVTNINQVDPAYRAFFRSQNGRNFSMADQRKALVAAVKTSRTPVPKYVPRVAASKAQKRTRKASRTRIARYSKSKARSTRRYTASRSKKRRAIASRAKRRRR